jgi:mannose-1-phosphate guanylyltransferase
MVAKEPKAVILAGGMGTRLQPYTFFLPKPMLPLADKPLLEHLILWLKANGVNEIILTVSYMRHVIESYFGNGNEWNVKITFIRSNSPLGISGQLLTANKSVDSTFYLLYGDSVFDFDLGKMLEFHHKSNATLTIGVMRHTERYRYGLIERAEDGRVLSWREKPEIGGLVNVGCYVAEPRIFDYIPPGKMYGFDSVVSDMMNSGEKVYSYIIEGKEFLDIGDESSYKRAYNIYLQKLGKVL